MDALSILISLLIKAYNISNLSNLFCFLNKSKIVSISKLSKYLFLLTLKILLDSKKIHLILSRLVYELIENHKDFQDTVLIGLQPRGVYLFNQILKVFETNHPNIKIKSGILDFTFFRDDFRRTEKTLSANSTQINFTLENYCFEVLKRSWLAPWILKEIHIFRIHFPDPCSGSMFRALKPAKM